MFVILKEHCLDRETCSVSAVATRHDELVAQARLKEIVQERVEAGGRLDIQSVSLCEVYFTDHDENYWIESVEDTG
jgi:hypothetical protein